MSLTRAENLRDVGVPGFVPHGPDPDQERERPGPPDLFGSGCTVLLPLVVIIGAGSIRLAAGFGRGEPMTTTMSFLAVLVGASVLGLLAELLNLFQPPRSR